MFCAGAALLCQREKKHSAILVKDGQADYSGPLCSGRDHRHGILQCRKEVGLKSKYNVNRWEL